MNEVQEEAGPAGPAAAPEPIAAAEDWQVIHTGIADAATTPAARAVMRTSDGEFRITALHVEGKVGLTIEVRKPESAAQPADQGDREGDGEESIGGREGGAGGESEKGGGETLSPVIPHVRGSGSLPRPRRADLEAIDADDAGTTDHEGLDSEAA